MSYGIRYTELIPENNHLRESIGLMGTVIYVAIDILIVIAFLVCFASFIVTLTNWFIKHSESTHQPSVKALDSERTNCLEQAFQELDEIDDIIYERASEVALSLKAKNKPQKIIDVDTKQVLTQKRSAPQLPVYSSDPYEYYPDSKTNVAVYGHRMQRVRSGWTIAQVRDIMNVPGDWAAVCAGMQMEDYGVFTGNMVVTFVERKKDDSFVNKDNCIIWENRTIWAANGTTIGEVRKWHNIPSRYEAYDGNISKPDYYVLHGGKQIHFKMSRLAPYIQHEIEQKVTCTVSGINHKVYFSPHERVSAMRKALNLSEEYVAFDGNKQLPENFVVASGMKINFAKSTPFVRKVDEHRIERCSSCRAPYYGDKHCDVEPTPWYKPYQRIM